MKKLLSILLFLVAFLFIGLALDVATAKAQNVIKEGNTFVSQKTKVKETKTTYTYKDSQGKVYPVYLSSTGKAYIIKVSKKTGKEYKQYVPEIGKQINPNAYKK